MSDPSNFQVVNFSDFLVTDDDNCKTPSSSDLISIPNSNAFIDFDGDCLADIFLTKQKSDGSSYYEIYSAVEGKDQSGNPAQKFCLASQDGKIKESGAMPLIEIADINRDAMMDLAFMTDDGKLTILYNQYNPAGPKEENLCKRTGNTEKLAESPLFESFPFSQEEDKVLI